MKRASLATGKERKKIANTGRRSQEKNMRNTPPSSPKRVLTSKKTVISSPKKQQNVEPVHPRSPSKTSREATFADGYSQGFKAGFEAGMKNAKQY